MLPEPLHPAVVHFPLVLATLLPLVVLAALVAIRRDARPLRAWLLPLIMAVALAGSAFVAVRTGEGEEEKVEAVVTEAAIHDHEEAAERFLVLSAVLAAVVAVGLASGTLGSAARAVALLGSLVVFAAGVYTGDLGGRLVYEHGAAAAWASTSEDAPLPDRAGERDALPPDRAEGVHVAVPGRAKTLPPMPSQDPVAPGGRP